MDLQHPLRSLVPSLDWAVLEVLAGTESGLGTSQIARIAAEGSRSGHAAVLDRLVRHGLVIAEPANHGYLYRLNRDHILASAIVAASLARGQVLERIGQEIEQFAPVPIHASVFGSFARGEANENSDIDLLLVAASSEHAAAWDDQIAHLESTIQRWTGNRCTCMALGVERARDLAATREPIVKSWVEDELLLMGESLRGLLESAQSPPTRRTATRRATR